MKKLIALTLALVMVLGLCACTGAGGGDKKTIGILMPTKEQTIWSIQGDRLVAGFEEAGYATLIEYAEDDTSKQVMQIENMITKGVDVLVIAAVDSAALTTACEAAKEEGVLIIADDRLITNTEAVDYYVTFDLVKMGALQGQYIADALDLEIRQVLSTWKSSPVLRTMLTLFCSTTALWTSCSPTSTRVSWLCSPVRSTTT